MDKIRVIQERMRAAQSPQKSYADRRRRPLGFQVGEQVFLQVSLTKGIARFGMVGKLSQGTLDRIQSYRGFGK